MTGLRRGGVVLALVLLLAACGSGGHARRDAVNAYLQDVRNAQADFVARQGQIDVALQSFSLKRMTSFQLRRLRHAHETIANVLQRLRALDPPPDAKRLEALLVQRIALQLALVDELRQTGRDVPRIAAAAAPLRAAGRRLGRDLAAISTNQRTVPAGSTGELLARYGEAFGAYGDALKPVLAKLARPQQPSLLEPAIAAEQRAVAHSISLCSTIRSSLERGDVEAANHAIASLFAVSEGLDASEAQAAQRAAAAAYNARVRKIEKLALAITTERNRLVRLVG